MGRHDRYAAFGEFPRGAYGPQGRSARLYQRGLCQRGSSADAIEAAYLFFDYLLGPEFGARIGQHGRYATVTAQGQGDLSPETKEEIFLKYVDNLGELVDFMLPPVNPDTGDLNYDEWITVWNEVKAA